MGAEITPDKDPLFSFDGAEGIAFWVSDEKRVESVKIMLDELPRLRAFLDYWFPQHDDKKEA